MSKELSVYLTARQDELIYLIASRAENLTRKLRKDGVKVPVYPSRQAALDLRRVIERTPLDLERLAVADDNNFAHDVFGIRRHLDRATGKLTLCFVPRHAASKEGTR